MSTGTQIALGVAIAVVLFSAVLVTRRRQPREVRPVTPGVTERVRALAADGRKIQAIKELRDHTGMPLKEAKNFVEALDVTGEPPVTDPDSLGDEVLDRIRRLTADGKKIQAIKELRDHVDLPLKDAKNFVETLDLTDLPPRRPVTEVPEEALARVYQLKAAGKTIQAIKLVREQTQWGLKDAKDYVDGL